MVSTMEKDLIMKKVAGYYKSGFWVQCYSSRIARSKKRLSYLSASPYRTRIRVSPFVLIDDDYFSGVNSTEQLRQRYRQVFLTPII